MISIKDMDMVMDMAMEMDTLRDGCNFPASVSSIELRFGIGRFCLSHFSSPLGPSTFNMLYYNSIRVLFLLCFVFSLLRLFFVSSASANYRIQLIYLLAILDSSFARRGGGETAGVQSQYRLDGSSIV